MTIIEWNGVDLPKELRSLPAGKYVLERAKEDLTPDEEDGLIQALDSLRSGKGVSHGWLVAEFRPVPAARDPLVHDPRLAVVFHEDPALPLEPEDWPEEAS